MLINLGKFGKKNEHLALLGLVLVPVRGPQQLTGENLKVVWAKFSISSLGVLLF
jgi:hypothetical protein